MKIRFAHILAFGVFLSALAAPLSAQDLGPHIKKVAEGIYVETTGGGNSNCGIILTQDGVVLIDSGHNPTDSREVLSAVKKLTSLPIRFLLHTEPHPDHVTGDFVFSPPAVVIAREGVGESIRKNYNPNYYKNLMDQSQEMRDALSGYKTVYPQIEYHDKMTLTVGERTFVLLTLKNVHSEADTAIWLPKERVLFAASAAVPDRFNNLRTFVTIPDILNATKMMKALNPEIVIPGHGNPGTIKIFDDSDQYYKLLMERVGKMAGDGKSLDQIKKELRMPEYDNWIGKDRWDSNVEAAYRAVQAGYGK
jgi:cyclase